jgi:hypothetical protein
VPARDPTRRDHRSATEARISDPTRRVNPWLEATHVNLRALLPETGDAVYVRSTVVGAGLAGTGVFLLGVALRRRA